MKGRLRRDWIRWARRAGRIESVKLDEARSWEVVSGGRPCLDRTTGQQALDGTHCIVLLGAGQKARINGQEIKALIYPRSVPSYAPDTVVRFRTHLTRSASVSGCSGRLASRAMSLSVTVDVCKRLWCRALAPAIPPVLRALRGQQSRINCD